MYSRNRGETPIFGVRAAEKEVTWTRSAVSGAIGFVPVAYIMVSSNNVNVCSLPSYVKKRNVELALPGSGLLISFAELSSIPIFRIVKAVSFSLRMRADMSSAPRKNEYELTSTPVRRIEKSAK
jgi:uncharacterized 2Fe-2S/4Fe-4S cluster protein (DUF4445 family)